MVEDLRDRTGEYGESLDLTVLVVMRDHENFVRDCLNSIVAELGDVDLIVIDVGSVDDSVGVVSSWQNESKKDVRLVLLPRSNVSLDAIAAAEPFISSSYIAVISADDAFGANFRQAALRATQHPTATVTNFRLLVCNSDLTITGEQCPRWTGDAMKDTALLSQGNPGTAPGCIIPWRMLTSLNAWSRRPHICTEDYWIWTVLAPHVRFVSDYTGAVLYRRHAGNLSAQGRDPLLAFSLGYCAGLAMSLATTISNRGPSVFYLLKSIRHIHWTQLGQFFGGLRLALGAERD